MAIPFHESEVKTGDSAKSILTRFGLLYENWSAIIFDIESECSSAGSIEKWVKLRTLLTKRALIC